MPEYYDKDGLQFAYPENWTLEDDEAGAAAAAATVSSPQTAFWSVMLYDGLRDTRELAECVLAALQSEYPQLDIDRAGSPNEDIGCEYHLSFSYLDLLNTATIRAFHDRDRTFLVLTQAEDRELAVVEPVFQAMTASLVQ